MVTEPTLIIDCQVFQTNAWDRGMGKYSLNLLQATLPQSTKKRKIIFCFSGNLDINKAALELLHEFFPQAEHITLDLRRTDQGSVRSVQEYNRQSLEKQFDSEILKQSIFVILALFIEPACPVFPDFTQAILLFYDIIPHMYASRYLASESVQERYYAHYKSLFRADYILTISETVRSDLIEFLGIIPEKISNIDGGAINRSNLTPKRPKLEINKKIILMPSGDDVRKNNEMAVQGFDQFNKLHNDTYRLLITSFFGEKTKKDLTAISDHIIFTGNVSENELLWLYEHADMILFPSEYEGLGLPILEAVAVQKPIVCSSIPVFREISIEAFYYFDPYKIDSLVAALTGCHDKQLWAEKSKLYKDIAKKYTWERTAILVNEVLNTPTMDGDRQKLKLAVFTPDPSGYSAIGKVVSQLHPSLSTYFEIDYFFDKGITKEVIRIDYLRYVTDCYDATDFSAQYYKNYDAVLYHLGNSEYHIETIKKALCYPGYIVCHDTSLEEVFELMVNRGDISTERFELEKALSHGVMSAFLTSLANAQLGIITHSMYARVALSKALISDIPIVQINLPVPSTGIVMRHYNERPKVGLAGILTANKGLDIIERIVQNIAFKDCDFHIFGYKTNDLSVLTRLNALSNVYIEPNLVDYDYQNRLKGLDVLICYRQSYRGETSLTTLEAMRYGVPIVVRPVGWFDELPDNSVLKAKSEDEISGAIDTILRNETTRENLRSNAAQTVYDEYSPLTYAKAINELAHLSVPSSNSRIADIMRRANPYNVVDPEIKRILSLTPKSGK